MVEIKSYFAKSDQGPYLNVNEDGVAVDLSNKLFMLFDGFGGANIGDETVSLLKDTIRRFFARIGGDPDSTLPFYYSPKFLLEANALINSIHYAHTLVKKSNEEKNLSNRGGASGIMALLSNNILTSISTGNCFSCLSRHGRTYHINRPDCFDPIFEDFSANHLYTTPLSGFGLFDDIHLQIEEIRLLPGDTFLAFSDGVYSRINDDDIKYFLSQPDLSNREKMEELFSLANKRGNLDNQSGILVRF